MRYLLIYIPAVILLAACKKNSSSSTPVALVLNGATINNIPATATNYGISTSPVLKFTFTTSVDPASVNSGLLITDNANTKINYSTSYEDNGSTVVVKPSQSLKYLTRYGVSILTDLRSSSGGSLAGALNYAFITQIDSSRKFAVIPDEDLLTLVQRQSFKYFWDLAHPVSGMARERNTSGDVVTTGGTGFGIMAILTAVSRNFITRAEGLSRIQTIVSFLKNKAPHFHGAFSHWLNGNSGAVVPFSTKDNGADLVETSYLVQGLLCARQYFNGADAIETALRDDINSIWTSVEWNWFRKNNENVLYWHWSPDYNWDMNMPVKGWNEALITYVLAASSPGYSIPKIVYDNGWASSGSMANNNIYFGLKLPLGPPYGGPLFFAHYSFLGINPKSLTDTYADYFNQNTNHTLINYNYCRSNPKKFYGYSDSVWGLTASDIPNGYTASSPTNDLGVIAPTAALSSFPYTPTESMKALKFYYYVLGDKIWKDDGFVDAFSLTDTWFADSYLAIDEGPIIVMIENYRSGLLWNLFMSCPEIKTGLKNLGFQSPYL